MSSEMDQDRPVDDALWSRFSGVRLKLHPAVHFHRHHYRGEVWFVVEDPGTGKFQRLSPQAHRIARLFDGQRTLEGIRALLEERLGDSAPTAADVLEVGRALLAAQVVGSDEATLPSELAHRQRRIRSLRGRMWMRSPLSIRLPLFDPDAFLERTLPWVSFLFSGSGLAAWLVFVSIGAYGAVAHWPELTENITDRVLAPGNLVILGVVFPVVKAVHELGHAYATKMWGGEVHEMGVMFIVFMPIPYVDASAATAIRDKHRRLVVGAGGMAFELILASIAMVLWTTLEPGVMRAVAYNVVLIASVSTVLFNANPLLRFDGYYILSDWLETPNLGARSLKYLGYLIHRHAFGLLGERSPANDSRERFWLAFYAVASFVYRMFVMSAIVLFVASKYFFVGVILAVWATIGIIGVPLYRQTLALFRDPRLERRRVRAIAVVAGALAGLCLLLGVVPMPMRTLAEGVVWLPEEAMVRPGTNGFVEAVLVDSGDQVDAGTPLVRLEDVEVEAEVRLLEARVHEQELLFAAAQFEDRGAARIAEGALEQLRDRLARARARKDDLVVRSPRAGQLLLERSSDLPGHFATRGDVLGYVVAREGRVVLRVVVPLEDVDLVRGETRSVAVRLSEQLDVVIPGELGREMPSATYELPSAALATLGGGGVALDPSSTTVPQAFERLFAFEVYVDPDALDLFWGQRAHVRFAHAPRPLAVQWYRQMRQMFLARFHV